MPVHTPECPEHQASISLQLSWGTKSAVKTMGSSSSMAELLPALCSWDPSGAASSCALVFAQDCTRAHSSFPAAEARGAVWWALLHGCGAPALPKAVGWALWGWAFPCCSFPLPGRAFLTSGMQSQGARHNKPLPTCTHLWVQGGTGTRGDLLVCKSCHSALVTAPFLDLYRPYYMYTFWHAWHSCLLLLGSWALQWVEGGSSCYEGVKAALSSGHLQPEGSSSLGKWCDSRRSSAGAALRNTAARWGRVRTQDRPDGSPKPHNHDFHSNRGTQFLANQFCYSSPKIKQLDTLAAAS